MEVNQSRACAVRTVKMLSMFFKLDVSKVSGWLNLCAYCRVGRKACDCRARCRPEGAGARARESGGGKGGARAEDLTVEGWCGRARAVSARRTYASFQ